eukprot:1089510-Prorocentrum_minimum.AAC.2
MSGGALALAAGAGGNSSSTVGGAGGAVSITAGAGATGLDDASGGAGGDVTIEGGAGGVGGLSGSISLGLESEAVEIGRRDHSKTVTVNGNVLMHSLQVRTHPPRRVCEFEIVPHVGSSDDAQVARHNSVVSSLIDPPEMLPTQTWFQDLAFPDAQLGDIVVASFSKSIGHCLMSATVVDTNTIRVVLFNTGVGDVAFDPEAGYLRISVWQY